MLSSLLERDIELADLTDQFAKCIDGLGTFALISGGVASGKTALMRAYTETATAVGATTLNAIASHAERDIPFGVLSQLFQRRDLPPAIADRVAGIYRAAALSPGQYDHRGGEPLNAAGFFESIRSILIDLADRSPLVIAIDDLQYSDIPSLRFVLYLIRRIATSRIFIVLSESTHLASADPVLHAEILGQPNCHRIWLAPLSEEGVATLLRRRLDLTTEQSWRLSRGFHRATGGNPLLVHALISDHQGTPCSTPMHCTSGNALGQAVLTLLHRCEAAMLDVAQAIAVLGDCTSPAIIAEFLDSEAEATLRVIAQLDSTGLMLSSRFRHESIRHAILAHMTRDERAAAHGKATRVLRAHGAPAAVLARHLLAADRIDPAWAAPVLLEGSRLALGDGDVDLACLYLRRAYDACGSDPRQAAIKSAIVRAEWRIDPAIAARHLPDLINSQHGRHLTDPDFAMLINHVLWHGPTDEAADTLNQLVGLVPEAAGETYSNAARLLFSCIYPELAGHVRRQEILAASTGTEPSATPLHLRAAFVLATVLTADGGEEEAVRGAEEILRVLHLNDSTVIPKTLALLSLAFLGKLEQAASWCHALLCEARQAPTWHALLAGVQAIIDLQYGDFINAEKHASAALDLLPAESAGIATGGPLASRLLAEVAQGKYTDAAVLLRLPVPKAMFQSLYGLRYLHARGRYYLSVSNLTAALADFESCGELMTRWQLEISIVPWRIDAAHAWLRMGDAQRARELANDQLARLRPSQSRLHGMCLRVLALTGDPRDRATLLGSAVESLQKAADRFETACALADLSEAYQALGEVDKARVAARRAIHLAEKCGAAPLESRIAAQAEITRQDIPIDMRLLDDLSGAERRVATLAADGYSNREISRKLHITVSTVEQHLTRVYRKLRVNRRVDLPHELSSTLREPWEASGLPDG